MSWTPELAQPGSRQQPAEARPDDGDVNVIGQRRPGEVGISPRVVGKRANRPAASTYWLMPSERSRRSRSWRYLLAKGLDIEVRLKRGGHASERTGDRIPLLQGGCRLSCADARARAPGPASTGLPGH